MWKSHGKRILSVLLCAFILAGWDGIPVRSASAALGSVSGNEAVVQESAAPEAVAANELTYKPYEDASYELTYTVDAGEGGGITITGYTGGASGELVIPDNIDGTPTVGIGNAAFSWCSRFTGELVLPDSLSFIGDYAFNECSGFTGGLVLPDNLSSIGKEAFMKCKGFNGTLVFSDNLHSIGDKAFWNCRGFTGDLVLPNSLSSIGNEAFAHCQGFNGTLLLPNRLPSIEDGVFRGCGFTGELALPDTLSSIGAWAFAECGGFTGKLVLPDSLSFIGQAAFQTCSGFTGELALPDSLFSIESSTFSHCSGFSGDLIIPDGVTKIDYDAFWFCSGFSGNVFMSDSVTSIASEAFQFDYVKPITIYAPKGSYGEAYALKNGYTYIEGNVPNKGIENEQVEQDSLQPLPDNFENENIGESGRYIILVHDTSQTPVSEATVTVQDGWDGKKDTYTTDRNGRVSIAADNKSKIITVTGTGYLSNVQTKKAASGKIGYFSMKKNTGKPAIADAYVIQKDKTALHLLKEEFIVGKGQLQTQEVTVVIENADSGILDTVQITQGNRILAKADWQVGGTVKLNVDFAGKLSGTAAVFVSGLKDGKTLCSRQLHVRTKAEAWDKLTEEAPTLELGSSFTADVENQDTPRFWGEGSMDFDTIIDVPLEIEYDKNKIKVYIGKSKEFIKQEGLNKDGILKCIEQQMGKKGISSPEIPVYPGVTLGINASIEVGGYLEGEFLNDNQQNVTGAILLKMTGSMETAWKPVIVLPLKLSLNGELSDEISTKLSLTFRDGKLITAGPIEVENELEAKITLEVLVGLEDVASLTAEGAVGATWVHSFSNTEMPNTVTVSGEAAVKGYLLGWESVFWSWEDEYRLYPKQEKQRISSLQAMEAVWNPLGRNYLLQSRKTAENVNLSQSLTTAEGAALAVDGVYPFCAPILTQYQGTSYLFYLNDDPARPSQDRTVLVYRTDDGTGWSAENRVEDDGTADFAFDVETGADGIHILWQDATGSLTGAEKVEAVAESLRLKTACITENSVSKITILEATAGSYPQSPDLFTSDGKIWAGWYENSENAFWGSGTQSSAASNSIYIQSLDGSARTLLTETDMLFGSVCFGRFQGNLCAAFSADVDSDYLTMEDREILLVDQNGIRSLTFNETLDSSPRFLELDGKQCLVYYSGETLLLTDGAETLQLTDDAFPVSDSYRLYSEGKNAAIVFKNSYSTNGLQSLSLLEYRDGTWSQKGSVADTTGTLRDFCLYGSGDGTVQLAYTVHPEAADAQITRLYAGDAVPKGQVILTALDYDTDAYAPGDSFPIRFTLADAGQTPIKQCIVRILDEQENTVWEQNLEELPAGEKTVDVETTTFTPEGDGLRTYRLAVFCDGTENISSEFQLGGADLSVSHEVFYEENEKILNVSVQNTSSQETDAVLVISTDDASPVELYRTSFEALPGWGGASYLCKLDGLLEQADGANLTLTVSTTEQESTYINNEDLVVNYLAKLPDVAVSLDREAIQMTEGENAQLTATVEGADAAAESLTWSSSNPSCAEVTTDGKVTAVSAGVAVVTASTGSGFSASCRVSVEKAAVVAENIVLSETELVLETGGRAVLLATVTPENAADKTVTWSTGNAAVVDVKGGNLMAAGVGTTSITASVGSLSASCQVTVRDSGTEPEPEITLGDVPQDSWKYEPALYVYKRGVMTGKGFDGDGNVIFAPDEPLTREQFAQVLYSAEGKENVTYTTRFSDVADGQWYTNAVLWAADKGIVSGYEGGRYGVGDPITREQLAAMLYKYAQYKGYDISAREAFDRFTDADQVSGWAVNQLQWAVANGVMSGKGETLDPLGSATRAECAAMLRTFLMKFE